MPRTPVRDDVYCDDGDDDESDESDGEAAQRPPATEEEREELAQKVFAARERVDRLVAKLSGDADDASSDECGSELEREYDAAVDELAVAQDEARSVGVDVMTLHKLLHAEEVVDDGGREAIIPCARCHATKRVMHGPLCYVRGRRWPAPPPTHTRTGTPHVPPTGPWRVRDRRRCA